MLKYRKTGGMRRLWIGRLYMCWSIKCREPDVFNLVPARYADYSEAPAL